MAVVMNPPMTEALSNRIQPKLVEIGWSVGGEDSSPLSEYICLMLQNGKSQDQIAAELSGDLLGLDPGDLTAIEFSRWLFEQVDGLAKETQGNGDQEPTAAEEPQQENGSAMDHDMGDVPAEQDGGEAVQNGVPTAPKAMRQPQGRRLFNQLTKAMDRSQSTGPIHRTGPQGLDRIDSHKRDPPKGPSRGVMRGQITRPQGRMNGRSGFGPQTAVFATMNPQQQMQFYQLYHQQHTRIMAPYMPGPSPHMGGPLGHHPHPVPNHQPHHPHPHLHPQALSHPHPNHPQMHPGGHMGMPSMMRGPMVDEAYANNFAQPRRAPGSLFDRIQTPLDLPRTNNNNNHQNGDMDTTDDAAIETTTSPPAESSAMDQNVDKPMEEVACKFAAGCTKPECPFAHPTPAALPGKPVTFASGEKCSYGNGCKNRKCTGSHPSPAAANPAIGRPAKLDQECKFFPNCTNPACPFKHPDMPLCRNGANCTRPGCHFTHTEVKCKFSPCLNPNCIYKHDDGQQKSAFDHKVWTKDNAPKREHVSERRFVTEDGEEELIIPGQMPVQAGGGGGDMDTAPLDDVV